MLKKLTGPGLFRLFLALLVFAHHISRFAVGTCAVYVFFCLSGFWIQRMYVRKYSATRLPYLTFTVSRAWRLFPTFWLVTAITLVYLWASGRPASYWVMPYRTHFVLSNLFLIGYHQLPRQPLIPAWSLDIEMQFYLVAPFIALLLARRKRLAGLVLIAAAAVSLGDYFLNSPISVAQYLVYFVIGMIAAATDWRPSGRLVLGFLGAMAILVACCLASPWRGVLLVGAHPGPLAIYSPHANVVLALLAMPYAIYTTRQRGFSKDGMFADLSYVVYLLHWPATLWIDGHQGNTWHRLGAIVMGSTLVMGISLVIWKFYDHPINRLRSRWVNAREIVGVAGTNPALSKPARAATL